MAAILVGRWHCLIIHVSSGEGEEKKFCSIIIIVLLFFIFPLSLSLSLLDRKSVSDINRLSFFFGMFLVLPVAAPWWINKRARSARHLCFECRRGAHNRSSNEHLQQYSQQEERARILDSPRQYPVSMRHICTENSLRRMALSCQWQAQNNIRLIVAAQEAGGG